MIRIFTQNSFQSISVIFCLLVPDVLKIAFSTMDLLYNRIVLYNRIIIYNRATSSLVLFIFTVVTFGIFDIIYFHLSRHWILAGFCGECAVKMKQELKFYL